jgi:hypothetical protein
MDEPRTEVNVELHQRRITNSLDAINLTGLDDKDISGAALEALAVNGPYSPAFTDELDLVIWVPVRTRSRTGLPMEQEHRNTGVALLSSDKLMRTTNKGQILLAHVMQITTGGYWAQRAQRQGLCSRRPLWALCHAKIPELLVEDPRIDNE